MTKKTDSSIVNTSYETGVHKLWGQAGGQLEYVSQRVEYRQYDTGKWYKVMIIRMTDHDHSMYDGSEDFPKFKQMVNNKYYDVEIPISEDI